MKFNFCALVLAATVPLAGCYRLDCSFDSSCPTGSDATQLNTHLDLKLKGAATINFLKVSDLAFTGSTFLRNEQHIVAAVAYSAQLLALPLPTESLSPISTGAAQGLAGDFVISAATLQEKFDFRKLRCGNLTLLVSALEDHDNPGKYKQNSDSIPLAIQNGLPSVTAYAAAAVGMKPVTKIGFHPYPSPPYAVYANYLAGAIPTLGFGQLTSGQSPELLTLPSSTASQFQFLGETTDTRLALQRGAPAGPCDNANLLTCTKLTIGGDLSDPSYCSPSVSDFPWCFPAKASDAAANGKFLANISADGGLYVDEVDAAPSQNALISDGLNVAVGDLDDDQHDDVLALRKAQAPVIYFRKASDDGFIASTDKQPIVNLPQTLFTAAPELGNEDAVVAIGQFPGTVGGSYIVGSSKNVLFILIPGSGEKCPLTLPALMPATSGPVTAITLAKTQAQQPADLLLIGHSGAVHVYKLAVAAAN